MPDTPDFQVPTPGDVLRKHILDATITQDVLARAMGVSRLSVSEIVNGHRSISPEMAVRLSYVLSTSPEFWLQLQLDADLQKVMERRPGITAGLNVLRNVPYDFTAEEV